MQAVPINCVAENPGEVGPFAAWLVICYHPDWERRRAEVLLFKLICSFWSIPMFCLLYFYPRSHPDGPSKHSKELPVETQDTNSRTTDLCRACGHCQQRPCTYEPWTRADHLFVGWCRRVSKTQWWISCICIFVDSFPVTWLILIFRDSQLSSLKILRKRPSKQTSNKQTTAISTKSRQRRRRTRITRKRAIMITIK